jgi:hypothetical protein
MITDEEIENLPEDPELAFVEFEKKLRDRVLLKVDSYRPNESDFALDICRLKNSYISKMIGMAVSCDIKALKDCSIPPSELVHEEFERFLAEVDSITTQIRVAHLKRTKQFSVALDAPDKKKIHHYVEQIRIIIEAADLEEHKKNSLFKKLHDFNAEVDLSRTGWQRLMNVQMEICGSIGKGVEKLQPAKEWLDKIVELFSFAKEAEETLRLPYKEPSLLAAPRKQITHQSTNDLEEDIPF